MDPRYVPFGVLAWPRKLGGVRLMVFRVSDVFVAGEHGLFSLLFCSVLKFWRG